MRVVTLDEMKDIEACSSDEFKYEESLAVENVGLRGADFIEKLHLTNEKNALNEVLILVGRGNNGADGLCIGRHLANRGYRVRAFMLLQNQKYSETLENQIELAQNFGVKISDIEAPEDLEAYIQRVDGNVLFLDAILGTGFRAPLSNKLFDIINLVNDYSANVISLDISSGVDGNSGEVQGIAVESTQTLSIGFNKTGYFQGDGPRYLGELFTLDVGIPSSFGELGDKTLLTKAFVSGLLKERSKFAHKNIFGHTLVVGGSLGLTGAAIMASRAALRVGSGLVTAATWEENYYELSTRMIPEIMTGVIPVIAEDVKDNVRNFDRYSSLVVGPGLGQSEAARSTVLEILSYFSGPVVIDADAIRVLDLDLDLSIIANRKYPTIFTPHLGEFSDLIKEDKCEVALRPLHFLKQVVEKTNACFLLKGPCSFLAMPTGKIYFNYFPNEGMATGGTGDVLSGILGGLLAGISINDPSNRSMVSKLEHYFDALIVGLYSHSLSGEIAAKELGPRTMNATSLIDHLASAFDILEGEGR